MIRRAGILVRDSAELSSGVFPIRARIERTEGNLGTRPFFRFSHASAAKLPSSLLCLGTLC
jgi:hypothetical protein